jgi:hypothetical protein
MTLDEINDKLKSLRANPLVNGYCAWEKNGDETYGLNYSQVQKVAREIKPDPCLADELYCCQNYDMKMLATLIDDPKSYTRDDLEKRSAQLYPSPFSEKFCQLILANTDYAVHFIDEWSHSNDQNLKIYAYNTLAEIARRKSNLSVEFFSRYFKNILNHSENEPKDVQEAMNQAAEAISSRDEKLRLKNFQAAGKAADKSLNPSAGSMQQNQMIMTD